MVGLGLINCGLTFRRESFVDALLLKVCGVVNRKPRRRQRLGAGTNIY